MRTHAEILRDAGGWRAVRDLLGMAADDSRVKFWFLRNSIPAEYWKEIADLKLTTAEELAMAAHRRRLGRDRAA